MVAFLGSEPTSPRKQTDLGPWKRDPPPTWLVSPLTLRHMGIKSSPGSPTVGTCLSGDKLSPGPKGDTVLVNSCWRL